MDIKTAGCTTAAAPYLRLPRRHEERKEGTRDALPVLGRCVRGVAASLRRSGRSRPFRRGSLVETTFGLVERLLAAQKQLASALSDTAVYEVARAKSAPRRIL